MNRTLVTILLIAGVLGVFLVLGPLNSDDRPDAPAPAEQAAETPEPDQDPAPDAGSVPPAAQPPAEPQPAAPADADTPAAPAEPVAPAVKAIGRLKLVEAAEQQPEPVIGDDARDPAENPWAMKVQLTPLGAAVRGIWLSRYSTDALEHIPYQIQDKLQAGVLNGDQPYYTYALAAQSVTVNGQTFSLQYARWEYDAAQSTDSRKVFTILIADAESGQPVLRLKRAYELQPGYTAEDGRFVEGRYDLQLHQTLENLGGAKLQVSFSQYGQADMPYAKSYLGDRRTVVLGYYRPEYDPGRTQVAIDGTQYARKKVLESSDYATLWPTDASAEHDQELVFVAMSNRYFTTAVHGPTAEVEAGDQTAVKATPLDQTFPRVSRATLGSPANGHLLTTLSSDAVVLEPGKSADLSLAFFAGPKAPELIDDDPVYSAIGLDNLIIYNHGGCCSFLTFSWLADFLIGFLKLIHAVVFDWGVAIIILVLVVRLILHPVTKKSQVNMMKFGKQMQALQPELEKLKAKYKDNQQKLNQEMMKLYREKGVNPAAMGLGCLPMFLQMPIWVALYAMLFFAIELRHQPAFYDVFHRLSEMVGQNWRFLTDLSAPDHFIRFGREISVFGLFTLDSVNILPILMAVVFFIQQKFTTQPTATMSDQAKQQQKIMKFMTLLFPVFLYKAPSGLTLYILASTAAGIVDSYFVRKHLNEQEEAGTLFAKKSAKPGGLMDRVQKAADAKRRQLEDQQRRMQGKQAKSAKRKRR